MRGNASVEDGGGMGGLGLGFPNPVGIIGVFDVSLYLG